MANKAKKMLNKATKMKSTIPETPLNVIRKMREAAEKAATKAKTMQKLVENGFTCKSKQEVVDHLQKVALKTFDFWKKKSVRKAIELASGLTELEIEAFVENLKKPIVTAVDGASLEAAIKEAVGEMANAKTMLDKATKMKSTIPETPPNVMRKIGKAAEMAATQAKTMQKMVENGFKCKSEQEVADALQKAAKQVAKMAREAKDASKTMKEILGSPAQACSWTEHTVAYSPGCSLGCKQFTGLDAAQAACSIESSCGGVTHENHQGKWFYELRAGSTTRKSPHGETTYLKGACSK